MSNNNTFAREPNWDELQDIARLYLIQRAIREASEKKPDERTPEEKKLDELEEYNPHFSRDMWRGEIKGEDPSKLDLESLLAQLSLSSR